MYSGTNAHLAATFGTHRQTFIVELRKPCGGVKVVKQSATCYSSAKLAAQSSNYGWPVISCVTQYTRI